MKKTIKGMLLALFLASTFALHILPAKSYESPLQSNVAWYTLNSRSSWSWKFSFVHLTDLHIGEGIADYGTPGFDDSPPVGDVGTAAQRLRAAVNWINANKGTYKIKLVIVTGDLTDSAEKSEFMKTKEILDALDDDVPYVPLLGNHDVWPYTTTAEASTPIGDRYFKAVFDPHFSWLQTRPGIVDWNDGTRNTLQPYTPDTPYSHYFQTFAFSFQYGAGARKYHFICTDFNPLWPAPHIASVDYKGSDIMEADLHDASSIPPYAGTWNWFRAHYNNYIQTQQPPYPDHILIFAHHPLNNLWGVENVWLFNPTESETARRFLCGGDSHNRDYCWHTGLWLAGHLHRNVVEAIRHWGWLHYRTVCPRVETAACKDNWLRVVKVYGPSSGPTVECYPEECTGQEFSVDIAVANVTNLWAWNASMTFDPSVLQCLDAEEGPFLRSGGSTECVTKTIDNTIGVIKLAYTLLPNSSVPVNGGGALTTAIFKAITTANSSLHLANVTLYDPANNQIVLDQVIDGYFTPKHDILVSGAAFEPLEEVYPSWNGEVKFGAMINNTGNFPEMINITSYLIRPYIPWEINGTTTLMGSTMLSLPAWNSSWTIPFKPYVRNMTLYEPYLIMVEAKIPFESDIGDNVLYYYYIIVKMDGDINCDRVVNIYDLAILGSAWLSENGEPNYNLKADINCDGAINIFDLAILGKHWLEEYP